MSCETLFNGMNKQYVFHGVSAEFQSEIKEERNPRSGNMTTPSISSATLHRRRRDDEQSHAPVENVELFTSLYSRFAGTSTHLQFNDWGEPELRR
jgi:hypothetical protein